MGKEIKWQKFKKKPIIIGAFQITKELLDLVPKYCEVVKGVYNQGDYVTVATLEGGMRGEIGDWIIRGIEGEVYPCKPDIFEKTYKIYG